MRPRARSLKLRLLLGAAIWIVAALLVAGVILSELFAQHVHDRFRIELGHHLDQLAAALDVDDRATQPPLIVRPLSDPRFERPLSGLYWQVSVDGAVVLRSRSLWDQVLDLPADSVADGQIHEHRLKGPLEWPVRVLERSLWLPDHSTPVRIAVGEDQDEIHRALRSFNQTLILSLAALATVLILAALVQVSLGLRPLGWLRAELATIRSGGGRRFVRPMPSEVQPLIDDLNALLDHADEVVERARLEAGNLAHSLKTHLCVLANEAEQLASLSQPNELAEVGQQIRGRVDAMRRNLDHHMARARAAASHGLPGASTDVAECAAALVRVMTKVHAERHLTIRCDVPAGLLFAGDRQDLEQMLGNLLDNACKWARAKVDVGSNRDHPMLVITVDDDGPGLRPEQRQAALSPGVRLDETLPGSGLGLAVVGDLVRLYGGELKLAQSPLGGLRASLRLPAVANQHPA